MSRFDVWFVFTVSVASSWTSAHFCTKLLFKSKVKTEKNKGQIERFR